MEQATVERSEQYLSREGRSNVAKRLAALRKRAKKEPEAARAEAWSWFRELGDHHAEAELNELFALGKAPKGLDGPTDGILVVSLIQGVLDRALGLIPGGLLPWRGKRFDAAANRGDNLLLGAARLPAKLIWPRYHTKPVEGGRAAFDFETRVERGEHDPDTEVLVIDYAPVQENPGLLIRSIRDELVEVVPGANLGKILYRTGDGYRNLGFFALQPAR